MPKKNLQTYYAYCRKSLILKLKNNTMFDYLSNNHMKIQSDMDRCIHVIKRRITWFVLVMISRKHTVSFPFLGDLNLFGVRLWLVCIFMVLWAIFRVQ